MRKRGVQRVREESDVNHMKTQMPNAWDSNVTNLYNERERCLALLHIKYGNINDNNKNNDKNNTDKKRLNKWVSQMWQEEISTKGRSREIMGREIRVMRSQLKDEGQTRRGNRARFSGLAVANISRWTEVRRCWWWWDLKGSWVEKGDKEGGDECKVVIDNGGDRQRWWKTKVTRREVTNERWW